MIRASRIVAVVLFLSAALHAADPPASPDGELAVARARVAAGGCV